MSTPEPSPEPSQEYSNQAALASISGLSKDKDVLPLDFLQPTGHGDCAINIPEELTENNSLDEILVFARRNQASDVHITANNPIIFRKFESLRAKTKSILSRERIMEIIQAAIDPEILSNFIETSDLEFIYTVKGAGRFRVTLMKQRAGWDFTARLIPMSINSFEESKMPESCKELTKWRQGLILIAGPAGCGKSSSLATLVDMINNTRQEHIISIENPIEFIYKPNQCQITQREIKRHTLTQQAALRAALRQDPDIIVVSELRDLDSIQLAISAAETGHLVFGTMNTNNASQTISTLIDSFPPDEQAIITSMVSESLRGVICQQLIPKKDGTGVVPAYEVLVVNTAAANMIRSGKTLQLNNAITTGKSAGMVLFDTSLKELVDADIIDGYEAFSRAITPANFKEFNPNVSQNMQGDSFGSY